jgi:phosphoribosyl 1,2-cyclic phosphodiesterase
VETFSVPHDAQDPVGFVLQTAHAKIGFATDLGHVTKLVLERIRSANVVVLESNHDVRMLQDCPKRPWSLKQRILSRHGHLSNDAAADCVAEIMSADLNHLFLGHLSRDCNKPELAARVMAQRLQTLGASHVHVTVTQQSAVSPTLTL